MIRLKNLTIGYGANVLLRDISADFPSGQLVALLGRNGTGKSTLLRVMAGLIPKLGGEIFLSGKRQTDMNLAERARQVSMVTTERIRIPYLRCKDLVALGRSPYTNWIGRMRSEDEAEIEQALHAVGMADYAAKTMNCMSDGECQRIMIARALVQNTPVVLLDEQIEITTETVESWKEYIHSLNALMKAGQADRATVSQAEASRLSAETSLISLKQQLVETENALCSLLFWQPGYIARGKLSEQSFPDTLSVGVPLELLSRRPDVMQAEAGLKQAFYTTAQARSNFYPSITLSGSAGWTNSGGAAITNPGAWLLQAVGSLVQPIFNRGQNVANLKISKAQQEEALLQFQQTLLDAGGEVNNALYNWQTARKKKKFDTEQVEHLTLAVHDTQLLMEHGTKNYLEVFTARQSLLTSRLTLVSDYNEEIQSIITLYHALGGGVSE